jgi:hypothetical protein
MRMLTGLVATALVLGVVSSAATQPAPGQENYTWSAACKECHAEVYDSWSRTKHAKTIGRLNAEERKAGGECIGCHVTGPKEPIMADGEMVNANVGCESCHGAGRAHVEAAKAGEAAKAKLVKKPQAPVCETCHNAKSPKFKGFYYSALVGLVHKK